MDRPYGCTPDGHVYNTNSILSKKADINAKNKNFTLSTAVITKKKFKDDKDNEKTGGLQYEAIYVDGPLRGTKVSHIESMNMFGGEDNYGEIVYKETEKTKSGKKLDASTPPEDMDGSYVYLINRNGNMNNPVIVGAAHKNHDKQFSKGDGIQLKFTFNGNTVSMGKDGTFKMEHGDTSIEMTKDGKIKMDTAENVELNSTGDTKINSSGNVDVASAGGMTFTGPSMSLGGAGASQSLVRGDAMATLFNSHTHSGSPPPDQSMGGGELQTKIKVE